jgi:GNAT superfamily N-acetyltransferase
VKIEVVEQPTSALTEYARISIAFDVRYVLDVSAPANGLGELLLTERAVSVPYVKDYDTMEGEGPMQWADHFDIANWGVLIARADGRSVGGATLAFDTPDLHMLDGRRDVAMLWDLRVAPAMRGRGVGGALFRAAEAWAGARGCVQLTIETQNTNVPACKFYQRNGCYLGAVRRGVYAEFPDELQLLWYKDLGGDL